MIADKKRLFGVKDKIPLATVRSRVRRGNLDPSHPGTKSPFEEAEAALVVICVQMGKIRQPLTCTEGMQLMNDLIKGTPIQDTLKEFQMVRKLGKAEFEPGTAGQGWWCRFKKRHENEIVTLRGEKFACVRGDWTKLSNINQMYDVIYDEMVDARIARKRDVEVFTDRKGNIVQETERFGLRQDIHIEHPDYLLFADESGVTTNQKKDGHIGGQKVIGQRGITPQIMCCTNDHKFTILPFTSASGEAVCCVVIFKCQSEEVPQLWKTGVDITVENPARDENGEIDFQMNFDEGKYYPGGPKCHYKGKEIDCLTFASEGGGINGGILVEILKYFDGIDLFPCVPGGPIPMLVVDGHQSRLDPLFIKYINDPGHKWKICFGVPYATVLWQVGDASEQNGKFKIEWYLAKGHLMTFKFDLLLPRQLHATDIIPLLNKVFHKSYDDVASNLKAVADRGWYPANRKLLEHPDLTDDTAKSLTVDAAETAIEDASENSTTDSTASSTPSQQNNSSTSFITLNIHSGLGATMLDRMINDRARNAGAKKAAEERKRRGGTALQNLKEAKKLSTGILASNGVHSLSDPRFLEAYNAKRAEVQQKQEKTAVERRHKLKKRMEGVKKLREKYGHESTHRFASFNKDECGVYLQYKKQSAKDPRMPTDLADRRARCLEWMGRQSPTASPHATDDEGDESRDDEDNAAAIASLLGLASSDVAEGATIEEEELGFAAEGDI